MDCADQTQDWISVVGNISKTLTPPESDIFFFFISFTEATRESPNMFFGKCDEFTNRKIDGEKLLLNGKWQKSGNGICVFTSCRLDAYQWEPTHTFLCAQDSLAVTGLLPDLIATDGQGQPWPYLRCAGADISPLVCLGRTVASEHGGGCGEGGAGGGWLCSSALHLLLPTRMADLICQSRRKGFI